MKLLIVGASGMIGQHVYDYALEQGYDVIGTCHQQTADQRLINVDILTQDIADVIDESFLYSGDEKAALVCVSMSKIDQCKLELDRSYQLNVVRTKKIIEELNGYGFKIMYTSSSAVYDGEAGNYSESSASLPITEYGRQKREVEQFIIDHCDHPLVFRLDKIVSDDDNKNNLFVDLLAKSESDMEIPCLEQVFSPTYVKDLGPIFLDAWRNKLSGIYNVCNPVYFSRHELAKQFFIKIGDSSALNRLVIKPMSYFNFAEPRMVRSDMNIGKLKNHLSFKFTKMESVIEKFFIALKRKLN